MLKSVSPLPRTQEVIGSASDSGTHLTEKSYSFTGLTARSYTISAGDRCKDKSETVTITQPNSVSIIAVNLVQPTCISNPNGGFTINVTGSPAGKYDYYIKDFRWSPYLF